MTKKADHDKEMLQAANEALASHGLQIAMDGKIAVTLTSNIWKLTDVKNFGGPPKVVKITAFKTDDARHKYDRESKTAWLLSKTGLAPQISATVSHKDYGFLVMDAYDTDLYRIASNQQSSTADLRVDLVLEETQLLRIFYIAAKLGQEYGVIHGDLKLDQFLCNAKGEAIVLSDFQFAGHQDVGSALHGWNWVTKCCALEEIKHTKENREWFNVFQLWYWLIGWSVVLIRRTNSRKEELFPRSHATYPFTASELRLPAAYVDRMFEMYNAEAIRWNLDDGDRLPILLDPFSDPRYQAASNRYAFFHL